MGRLNDRNGMLKMYRFVLTICMLAQAVALLAQAKPAQSHGHRNGTTSRLRLAIGRHGRAEIPGLYDDEDGTVTPIQGQDQFNQIILGLDANSTDCSRETMREAAESQTISLVQFYMATCPDCQGFSAYFKRFVRDIGPHWRPLVRLYVVNCNDHQNIHLCQEQNPKIIVPMVRWYKLPIIQRDARLKHCNFGYRPDMLSINHRQFIDEQRRDMISLRRATLKFIALMMSELALADDAADLGQESQANRRKLYHLLPKHWHQLAQIDREGSEHDSAEQLLASNLRRRMKGCDANSTKNFIIFEESRAFTGRTLIADWSGYACGRTQSQSNPSVLVHRTSNMHLLKQLDVAGLPKDYENQSPLLIEVDEDFEKLSLTVVASAPCERQRRHAIDQTNRLERIYQRASLERFYQRPGASVNEQPTRYAAAMSSATAGRNRLPRSANHSIGTQAGKIKYEHANWVPEVAYPREEEIRYKFNRVIATKLQLDHHRWPGTLMNGDHPGEIKRNNSKDDVEAVDPVEDDLTLMYLTDYYKGLDQIVHIDMLIKDELDGFQLLASCNFLRDLKLHFPFQGNALGSSGIGAKSIARYYIELVQNAWLHELNRHIKREINNTKLIDQNLVGDATSSVDTKDFEKIHVSSKQLEKLQLSIKQTHDLGLPKERHLNWFYCAGSSRYLRGHTCSLWILFHTMTVNEYLRANEKVNETFARQRESRSGHEPQIEYEFQIDYSKPPRRACDPANPDEAYLAARTHEHYLNSTQFVLANIINFVRFYLPCTNCAAHFSCMVNHSPGLHFDNGTGSSDSHLLWLWEGHNRVNERTRNTHSEDPLRPKHIFPQFGACPKCYIEQPKANASLTSMRFNRPELVKFIVARYRKSAILNNKLNIEDLYKKTDP